MQEGEREGQCCVCMALLPWHRIYRKQRTEGTEVLLQALAMPCAEAALRAESRDARTQISHPQVL